MHLYLKCHSSTGIFQTTDYWFIHKWNIGRKWVKLVSILNTDLKKCLNKINKINKVCPQGEKGSPLGLPWAAKKGCA